jgi:hypothetical protein
MVAYIGHMGEKLGVGDFFYAYDFVRQMFNPAHAA